MSSSHGLEAKTDSTRRKLVLAACHTCRRRKAKCDGQRPACHLCQESGFDCTYDTLPQESRSGALKRKYAELEQKAKTQQELLDVLQGASEEEAARAFQQIRQGQGHDRVLASFTERNSRHGLSDNPKRSFEDSSQTPSVAASTSGLETGRQHSGLLAPRVNTVQGGPHTKPSGRGDPTRDLVRFRSHDGSTATPARTARASTSLRAKPLPDGLDRVQSKETIEPKSPGCRNKDLRSVQARDWGVSYTDTRNLILMLDHYFLWEHYSYHFFDENAFWEGLAAGGSEFCNKLLVHSIVAYTARSYQNFGPGQGDAAAHFALVEAKKIWEVEVANEIPANIAAGLLIHCVHGLNGLDQIAHHYIIQACRMAENAGFFSSRSRSQSRRQTIQSGKEKETSESSGKEFARTMSAWGVFSHQAFYCMVLNIRSFLTRPPPFDPPSNRMDTAYEPEYPQNPAAFLALTTRRFNARAKLYTILNNVVPSHKDFDSDFGSKDHLDATMCMFRSLLEWRGMLHYSLCPTETSPQHIFALHFEYHRAIIDLFRPFVEPDETVKPALGSLRKDATLEQALEASETSIHSLIWLLRTFEKRYSGRPIHVNLISPLLLVSYETISTLATEHSATDNHRATLIFCAHMLRYMAKVHPIAGLILRSLEQVTSRYDVPLPAEIYGMIEDLDKQDAYMADVNKVHSGLPIDLGRMHTADGSDQLGHLVRKMADADLND